MMRVSRKKDFTYSLGLILTALLLWNASIEHMMRDTGGVSASATLPPPASGNWTVTGNETYRDMEIVVNGNLTISGSLTLENVTLLINGSSSGPGKLLVRGGGAFTMRNGSSLSGWNNSGFFFEARNGSRIEINASTVSGCGLPMSTIKKSGMYSESGSFLLINSEVKGGGSGLVGVNARFDVVDSVISNVAENGILIRDGSVLEALRLNLTACQEVGIRSEDSSANMTFTRFESCTGAVAITRSTFMMRDCSIYAMGEHAIAAYTSTIDLIDCYSPSPGMDDLFVGQLSGPSDVDLLNTTLSVIVVEDDATTVREAYRFDIHVTTNGGLPAASADVEVKDRTGKREKQDLTDDTGWILDIPVVSLIHNRTGTFSMDPHTLSVSYEGAARSREFNASGSHYTSISAILSEPIIEFLSPKNGSWLSDRSIEIKGRISDPRPLTYLSMFIDRGPEVPITPRKDFRIPIQFGSDGEHVLRMRAMNDDGRISENRLFFGIDTIPPGLTVSYPEDGTLTNSSQMVIRGTCDPDSDLFIQGENVPHGNGSFSFIILLQEGTNTIEIRAVDRANNEKVVYRTVELDSSPPTVMIFSPTNGTKTRYDWIDVKGAVSHDTVELFVNGVSVDFDLRGFSHRVTGLTEGQNRIWVKAVDGTGSTRTAYVWIEVDSVPPLLEVSDIPAYTNRKDLIITGRTERGAVVQVNGMPADINGTQFHFAAALYQGRNNISITASDEVENSITLYFDVMLDLEPPTFESIRPLDRSTFTRMVVQVHGEVFDDTGIRAIRGYNDSGPGTLLSTTGSFDWVITLSPGENVFRLEAEDLASNIRTTELHYTYDNSPANDVNPPTIFIVNPLDNETLQEGLIRVNGTSRDDRGIAGVMVRVDDGEWIRALGTENWEVELNLTPGVYLIEAVAEDTVGNRRYDHVRIIVVHRGDGGQETGEKSSITGTMVTVLAVLILLSLIAVIYLFMRNRKLREEWQEELSRARERPATGRRKRPRMHENGKGGPFDREIQGKPLRSERDRAERRDIRPADRRDRFGR